MKKILSVEDYSEGIAIENVLRKYSNSKGYELTQIPDLSDERVYRRHLPEDYDIYWLHGPAVEWDAIDEIREKQPWSKIVVRNGGGGEAIWAENYLERNKIDVIISRLSGIDERIILTILKNFGVKINDF